MAGFFAYAIGGVGFLIIAATESLSVALPLPRSLPFVFAASLSILAVANSVLTSVLSALASSSADPIGSPLPLSSLPVAAFFLLFSLSSLLSLSDLLSLPSTLLHFLSLSAFIQEFLLFRLRNNKDPDGLENRYFDLLLVPILICAGASLLAIARPRSPFPRLARAAGLALQGSWLLQTAFSLFTSLVAHGCVLRRRSSANFTVVCHGHADIHRSGAIATLQFNCHLAGLVTVAVGFYAILAGKNGSGGGGRGIGGYNPINKELHRMEHISTSHFTLDSDEDEETNMPKQGDAVSVPMNGFGAAH
ncbi:uncharacterized protein LOC110112440 [Dendrobium catenatum]|uniref:Uncharacterized protein n=1 Tax=Dendrobium catenatum TaxID=906689 RepID=A0A2I0VGH5_9ASPA|nr:uncharacterized protein LOC110112440 [Dendrobium catenatum]XP_020700320.1 uncharacterized protein LOC110112440 [Dendrobium catenatum]XP_020700322.1 uncharacterized protein LOC110112440 [Dendrobium catenatum]PKU62512.1 hypothetical protein MA16_Dca022184 [Dendrobium catenatum]